jgi:hypothetical protein
VVIKGSVDLKGVRTFLQDSGSPIYQRFLDKKWLALLSYLPDIFDKHNGLNSLQDPNTTVLFFFRFFYKVLALTKKTMLSKRFCES